MPVDIESFTTEVTLVDKDSKMSPQHVEQLIQEIMRRIERKQRADQQAEQNASFDQMGKRRK